MREGEAGETKAGLGKEKGREEKRKASNLHKWEAFFLGAKLVPRPEIDEAKVHEEIHPTY